jgi:hypothetical protein
MPPLIIVFAIIDADSPPPDFLSAFFHCLIAMPVAYAADAMPFSVFTTHRFAAAMPLLPTRRAAMSADASIAIFVAR